MLRSATRDRYLFPNTSVRIQSPQRLQSSCNTINNRHSLNLPPTLVRLCQQLSVDGSKRLSNQLTTNFNNVPGSASSPHSGLLPKRMTPPFWRSAASGTLGYRTEVWSVGASLGMANNLCDAPASMYKCSDDWPMGSKGIVNRESSQQRTLSASRSGSQCTYGPEFLSVRLISM